MAAWEGRIRTCGLSLRERSWCKPGRRFLATYTTSAARRSFPRFSPALLLELHRQPPAAPATAEVASVYLARWAPHPSAGTAPGTEPSPGMPAPGTMPPRQKLVYEATSGKAVTPPVAEPSKLPVAEYYHRRAAAPRDMPGLRSEAASRRVKGNGQDASPTTRSLLHRGSCQVNGMKVQVTTCRDLLQRAKGFAKLAG